MKICASIKNLNGHNKCYNENIVLWFDKNVDLQYTAYVNETNILSNKNTQKIQLKIKPYLGIL